MPGPVAPQIAFDLRGEVAAPPRLDFDFPATRYQGSKRKLLPWLHFHLSSLDFDSALDAFGGTGAVSYLLREQGKLTTYNDYLAANAMMAKALLANPGQHLDGSDIEFILTKHADVNYGDFITRTYADIYFTHEENVWLDLVAQNIPLLSCQYKRAVAYYALFQSCIMKRPYNLFHRKNLYMRLAKVERSFGNKTSWDAPFSELFRRFTSVANDMADSNLSPIQVSSLDAECVPGSYDLVYMDPPYINKRGTGVDYFGFYHFLEGLLDYERWPSRIDNRRKHLPITASRSDWANPTSIYDAFTRFITKFQDSTIVVSYRDNGIPSPDALFEMLRSVKSSVQVHSLGRFQYALSKDRGSQELLFVAH